MTVRSYQVTLPAVAAYTGGGTPTLIGSEKTTITIRVPAGGAGIYLGSSAMRLDDATQAVIGGAYHVPVSNESPQDEILRFALDRTDFLYALPDRLGVAAKVEVLEQS